MRRETPEKKRQDEKRLISEMIAYYCQKKHGSAAGRPWEGCLKTEGYAHPRLGPRPVTGDKNLFSPCAGHRYAPRRGGRIREVMRYSGPHMLIRHPLLVVRHALTGMQNKNTGKKGRGEG